MPRSPGSAPPPSARLRSSSLPFPGGRRPSSGGDGRATSTSTVPRRAFLAGLAAVLPGCAIAQPGLIAWPFPLPEIADNTLMRPLGGLEIDRGALGFGGLSALHVAPDLTVTAVSDLARFAQFSLRLDAAQRPMGMTLKRAGWLRDGAGRPLPRGYTGDAEALARLPDGSWLVGFERWHRIRRYRDFDGPGTYVEAPPGLDRAPGNGGLEALAVLADGRWLALAEDLAPADAPELRVAWLGGPGAWSIRAYRPAETMVPVDAAPLPDGGALVLERGFSLFGGFSGRLVRLSAATLAAPGVLVGEELLSIAPPLPVDNYEGIAAFRHEGRLLVAMVSDDNENRLQRSLLLLFELTG
jgi:hypothetical protein